MCAPLTCEAPGNLVAARNDSSRTDAPRSTEPMSEQDDRERNEPQHENAYLAERRRELEHKLIECASALDVTINDLNHLLGSALASDTAQTVRAAGNTVLADQYLSACERAMNAIAILTRLNDEHAREAIDAIESFERVAAEATAWLDGSR